MSYKRRQMAVLAQQNFYDENWLDTGDNIAFSNELDGFVGDPVGFGNGYPGPRETRILDSQNTTIGSGAVLQSVRDPIEWDTGGVKGQTKSVGSIGVTDPMTVDAHDFRGQMAVIRRMPDTNYGPVGTTDHNSLLSLLYQMQESAHYFPNEVSQADVIRAV